MMAYDTCSNLHCLGFWGIIQSSAPSEPSGASQVSSRHDTFAFEIIHHLAHSHGCAPIILLIHEVDHFQISLAFVFLALIVGCASGYTKQFALVGSARIPVMPSVLTDSTFVGDSWRYQCLSGIGIPNCLYKKSTSISNSPNMHWERAHFCGSGLTDLSLWWPHTTGKPFLCISFHSILFLHFRPITTNVVQLCPIESNKSTTSVTLVKIFSSGRSSGADLWQKCTRNGWKMHISDSCKRKESRG